MTPATVQQDPAPTTQASADELHAQLETLKTQLEEANQTITRLERRQSIDALLRDSEAIDVEAARLLTEIAVESMAEPNIRAAVEDLKRAKPYLFRRSRSAGLASAMPAHQHEADDPTNHVVQQAVQTGNRRDLLRYLRLRRKA